MIKRPFIVTTPRQLQVIASPGRDEILDAVSVIGPCTVSQLARFLGRSRHALYYHVRALKQCGLLRESRSIGTGRRATVKYEVPGRPLVVRFDFSTRTARQAVLSLAAARLRSAARGFARACHRQIAVVEGPRRNLWATRWTGTLTPQALEEANRLFARLIDLFGPRHSSIKDEQLFELTFVLAPTVSRRSAPA
jgi:DNA-binding MarR family transcriptional regulator